MRRSIRVSSSGSPEPDEFVLNVIDLAPARIAAVVQEQARQLANPPTTVDDLLDRL